MKVKFKRYDVKFHKHTYCILIPQNIGNLRVYNYENDEGTGWIGDRTGIKTLSYAAALLGFSPHDKIIYFPMRNRSDPGYYRYKDFISGEMCSGMMTVI